MIWPKALFVGGTFDTNSGHPSHVIEIMSSTLSNMGYLVNCINGGNYAMLQPLLDSAADYDYVFWFANVPNDLPKVRDVKSVAPKVMLVTSKRNDNEKYSLEDLVQRALGAKSNLLVEFSKNPDNRLFHIRVIDPLGCIWYEGADLKDAVVKTMNRLRFLRAATRQGTMQVNEEATVEVPQDFVDLIRDYAAKMQAVMPAAKETKRFIGNASMKPYFWRCSKGMPSFKTDKAIYVSRRNVDKQFITADDFVPVFLEDSKLCYIGGRKPSVDTPVQVRLYEKLPNIRYMIHTHCYIPDAPFTSEAIPCGAVEEVGEVMRVVNNHYEDRTRSSYVINMLGHGSIIMGATLDDMRGFELVARPFPEIIR